MEALSNLLSAYQNSPITVSTISSVLIAAAILAVYEFVVYRFVSHRAFYNKSFYFFRFRKITFTIFHLYDYSLLAIKRRDYAWYDWRASDYPLPHSRQGPSRHDLLAVVNSYRYLLRLPAISSRRYYFRGRYFGYAAAKSNSFWSQAICYCHSRQEKCRRHHHEGNKAPLQELPHQKSQL